MATQDQMRLREDRERPRIMQLWWALRPLTSVVRFMNTGAHPDDEITSMLAALTFRDGLNLSYACSTRGEGGQNDIGTESSFDLGALRTREMERACDVLNMRMYWLSETPEDSITDFGFSKSGVETLAKWGKDRTLARFVEIIRTDKPDIICPTFLDVPGQHGHHRAMTEAAHLAMAAAADTGFASGQPPWKIAKMYLPAWSGAGQAYDDDLPPPATTLTIAGKDKDPISGWSWERIGQQSRAYHRTQGMGRWVPAGECRDWPLHLAESHVAGPDERLCSGLPRTVADLADISGAEPIAGKLRAAGAAIDTAIAAFPRFDDVADAATDALRHIKDALSKCTDAAAPMILHRLQAKEDQLGQVLRFAKGIEVRARTSDIWLHPGDTTDLEIELDKADADVSVSLDLPKGWTANKSQLSLPRDAAPSDPYRSAYDPTVPAAPALVLDLGDTQTRVALDAAPVVMPAVLAEMSPNSALLNTNQSNRTLSVAVSGLRPLDAEPELDVPNGWLAKWTANGFDVTLPDHPKTGAFELPLNLGGRPAFAVRRIAYDHVEPTARAETACLRVLVADIALPKARIGYIGSGNDQVDEWLAAVGMDVTPLEDADLSNEERLAGFDSLVIGIFAMRFRSGLVEAMPRIHRWVENGGTLVTLYHRPWDNWDPQTIPPRPLEIGMPSLRWRVTDETAEVTHLVDHEVLKDPNPVGTHTWQGWVKERGLYFAKSWDAAYTPLLEMADSGEAPHSGSLLVADIGAGRHVHTSLILHHQMANLVPGAFQLMANLVQPRT
ncbi:MAG: PIG-L family deacetylase [Paracoccaceae bacterium]